MVRVVILSDSHGLHRRVRVPPGDLLIHAGDFTSAGELHVVRDFNLWLGELPHTHKVVIAGNHEITFEDPDTRERAISLLTNARYLEDREVRVEGLRIWGSPWQPEFNDWAFNLKRGEPLRAKWSLIPRDGVDVLVTHGPPHGVLDLTRPFEGEKSRNVGCEELLQAVREVKPRLHAFGHIHEAAGKTVIGSTTFVNASVCDFGYRPVNEAAVVDL